MADWVQYVVAIIVAIIASGGGYLLFRSQRRSNQANASSKLTGAAMDMVERWQVRIEKLEVKVEYLSDRIKVLEEENYRLRQGIGRLEGQLMSLGQIPIWKPPPPVVTEESE